MNVIVTLEIYVSISHNNFNILFVYFFPFYKLFKEIWSSKKYVLFLLHNAGPSQVGGHVLPHFLADQLTLSQPGGHIIPTQYYVPPPPYFRTLRRPWVGA